MLVAEKQWVNVQQKTFTKWLNSKISVRDVAVKDLVKDLSDGIILIHLLEVLSNESLGRYASNPKLRVQRFENVNKSLDYIRSKGIQMTNIGAEDIVDGNRKIVLGLIWTLILRFTISDINEEGLSAKEGLLLWCQRKTACYEDVEVRDFSTSWNDGLAFCALLDIHRPDLIDYDSLDKADHRGNMQLAFDIASKEIGIPDLLDVEDVCDVARPDERSLMTYIAYWFHAFSQMERVENAGRRVEKFVQNMQGAWEMESAYERRMRALLQQIATQQKQWQEASFLGTYVDAKYQASLFAQYKKTRKREWVAEKSDLAALLGNIKTKLSTYRLRPYDPPAELRPEALELEWMGLMKDEHERSRLINETIRDIKNRLRRTFADKANDFALALNTMSLAISGLEGDVEDQLRHAQRLHSNLPPLDAYLEGIEDLDKQCAEANIEENDFTTYTYDELVYELSLVKSGVAKKLAFLENQMVARNMTNLTPIQLEEFESVFRHFDRDGSNTLQELEFSAALASLGLVYDEDEMHEKFLEVCGTSTGRRTEGVGFEQFITFMVSVTEDQNTAEQVFQSFREVADGKPYVTEMDLRHSLIPDELIEDLIQTMPSHNGPDLAEDRDLPKYDYITFMEKMMGEGQDSSQGPMPNGGKENHGSGAKVNGKH
ncbi:putative alpha-actinin [Phaeomoniella chlamydospora]|uniref:Putative alpha-actinin n=1 Tax=Phaeomoniella chlamydospora TaxID=158046 RepID=A0A0G2EYG5_PHACM|nr:putative alpha-actinin [Phaeomoniella chlamydospora]